MEIGHGDSPPAAASASKDLRVSSPRVQRLSSDSLEEKGGPEAVSARPRPFSLCSRHSRRRCQGHGDWHGGQGSVCVVEASGPRGCIGAGCPGHVHTLHLSPQFTAARHSLVTPSASDDASGAAPPPPPSCPPRCPPGTGPGTRGSLPVGRTLTRIPGSWEAAKTLCVNPRPVASACPSVPSLMLHPFLREPGFPLLPSRSSLSRSLSGCGMSPRFSLKLDGAHTWLGRPCGEKRPVHLVKLTPPPGAGGSCGTPARGLYLCVPHTQDPVSWGCVRGFPTSLCHRAGSFREEQRGKRGPFSLHCAPRRLSPQHGGLAGGWPVPASGRQVSSAWPARVHSQGSPWKGRHHGPI